LNGICNCQDIAGVLLTARTDDESGRG
jgi:hypothetical protein